MEKNFNSYIFNNSNLQKTKINNITLKDLEKFVKQIGKFIFIGKINKKLIEPKKFLKYLEFNGKKKLSIEIKKTIKYINSCKSERKLYEYYNSTTELKKTWGSVLHYAALIIFSRLYFGLPYAAIPITLYTPSFNLKPK